MALKNTAAPSNWGAERAKIDDNWGALDSEKRVLDATNLSNQFLATPVGTGNEVDVNFGTDSLNETDFVTYDGVTVTFVQAGLYQIEFGLQVARTAAQQTSDCLVRSVYTPSGGSAILGPTRHIERDGVNDNDPWEFVRTRQVGVGDTFKLQFLKDAGDIRVQLAAYTPASTGWSVSPSAYLTVFKLNET